MSSPINLLQRVLRGKSIGELIDVGELRVSKTSLGKKRTGVRYLIYLPLNRNYLWEAIHEKRVKVRVYIEIPSEGLKRGEGKEPESI
jgi:hypothetical protein